MVKRALSIALLLCLAISAGASPPMEEQEAPRKRPAIKKVIIDKNATWTDDISSDETVESCTDFILRRKDIREFFRDARQASDREYGHDLLMSRCSSRGTVAFQNGEKGTWKIDRARRGMLALSDGRVFYFYCGRCRSKVFMEDCDIACINAP